MVKVNPVGQDRGEKGRWNVLVAYLERNVKLYGQAWCISFPCVIKTLLLHQTRSSIYVEKLTISFPVLPPSFIQVTLLY